MNDPTQPQPAPQPDTSVTTTTSSPPAAPSTTTTATTVKPGYKTTEFYLTILSNLVSILLIADVFPMDSTWSKLVGASGLVLSNLGYTVIRSNAKKAGSQAGFAALELLGALAIAGLVIACILTASCGLVTSSGVKADAKDCTTKAVKDLAKQFTPTLEQLISRATGNDGKVDMPSLETATAALEADGWCVLENTVARALSRGALPGAPQSSPQDLAALRSSVDELRAKKFGAMKFKVEAP